MGAATTISPAASDAVAEAVAAPATAKAATTASDAAATGTSARKPPPPPHSQSPKPAPSAVKHSSPTAPSAKAAASSRAPAAVVAATTTTPEPPQSSAYAQLILATAALVAAVAALWAVLPADSPLVVAVNSAAVSFSPRWTPAADLAPPITAAGSADAATPLASAEDAKINGAVGAAAAGGLRAASSGSDDLNGPPGSQKQPRGFPRPKSLDPIPDAFTNDDLYSYLGVEYLSHVIIDPVIEPIIRAHDIYSEISYNDDRPWFDRWSQHLGYFIEKGSRDDKRLFVKFISAAKGYDSISDYIWSSPSQILDEMGNVMKLGIDARFRGNMARFVNDVSNPNCEALFVPHGGIWHVVYITVRAIRAGEEVTVSYGNKYWDSRPHKSQEPADFVDLDWIN
ncbi:hypothetical protein HK405_006225 [Cladochytrium tenue]|nr:hypothetical protein HK405_006225 [Cladochytrium tenue]